MSEKRERVTEMETIETWDAIPNFADHHQEVLYWQGHEISPKLIQNSLFKSDITDSTTITIRMDPRMLSRIKRLAAQRFLNYQSMLKQWMAERIEKELEGKV